MALPQNKHLRREGRLFGLHADRHREAHRQRSHAHGTRLDVHHRRRGHGADHGGPGHDDRRSQVRRRDRPTDARDPQGALHGSAPGRHDRLGPVRPRTAAISWPSPNQEAFYRIFDSTRCPRSMATGTASWTATTTARPCRTPTSGTPTATTSATPAIRTTTGLRRDERPDRRRLRRPGGLRRSARGKSIPVTTQTR